MYLWRFGNVNEHYWFISGRTTCTYTYMIQQILSGLVVGVVYWTFCVVGLNPTAFHINFFLLN